MSKTYVEASRIRGRSCEKRSCSNRECDPRILRVAPWNSSPNRSTSTHAYARIPYRTETTIRRNSVIHAFYLSWGAVRRPFNQPLTNMPIASGIIMVTIPPKNHLLTGTLLALSRSIGKSSLKQMNISAPHKTADNMAITCDDAKWRNVMPVTVPKSVHAAGIISVYQTRFGFAATACGIAV